VKAVTPFEAWKASLRFPIFDSAKEGAVSKVKPLEGVLLNAAKMGFDFWKSSRLGQVFALLNKIQAFASPFVALDAFGKGGIIELVIMFQFRLCSRKKFLIESKFVLESFNRQSVCKHRLFNLFLPTDVERFESTSRLSNFIKYSTYLPANTAFCETGIGAGSFCFASLHNQVGGSKLLSAKADLLGSFFEEVLEKSALACLGNCLSPATDI
jgi:hypothetical protein